MLSSPGYKNLPPPTFSFSVLFFYNLPTSFSQIDTAETNQACYCQLIGKDPDAGKDWGQEEKAVTEDEIAGWHHWLNGHEFEQTLGDSERWGSLGAVVPGVTKSQTWLTEQQQNCYRTFDLAIFFNWVSQVALVVKNLPVNAGNIRDVNFILNQKDPLEYEMATHSGILAWRIPWTEDPGELQFIGSKD